MKIKLFFVAIVACLAMLFLVPANASAHSAGGGCSRCYSAPPPTYYHPPIIYHPPVHYHHVAPPHKRVVKKCPPVHHKPPTHRHPKPVHHPTHKPPTHHVKPCHCKPVVTIIKCFGYIETITLDERGVHIKITLA